jgi:tetratricopeptide (TPR) repeat protein
MTVHEYDVEGCKLLNKQAWGKAVKWYTAALAEHPHDSSLINRLAEAWVGNGEPEKALAEYNRQLEENPMRPEAESRHRMPDRRTRYTWEIDRAQVLDRRGNLYREVGEYDKAIADLNEAIPLGFPNKGIYWVDRGMAYRKKGDLYAALADMNAAMDACESPDNTAWTLYQRALVWQDLGKPERALADLTQATVNDPTDSDAFSRLGYFLFTQDELEEAIEAFSTAVELKDDDAHSWLAQGVCYWNLCVRNKIGFWDDDDNIIDRAEDAFTKAIECEPDMADAHFNRGLVRCAKAVESNNHIKAIAVQKATDDAERAVMLAQLEHIGGKDLIPQADTLLRGLRSNRDDLDVIMGESFGLFAEYDAQGAIEDLTRAIELAPDHAEAHYRRGRAYALLGERDKALADFEQACVLDPDHDKAAEKRDKLLGKQNPNPPITQD